MKFSIKDFFSKCDQIREKILNRKLPFLCSVDLWRFTLFHLPDIHDLVLFHLSGILTVLYFELIYYTNNYSILKIVLMQFSGLEGFI